MYQKAYFRFECWLDFRDLLIVLSVYLLCTKDKIFGASCLEWEIHRWVQGCYFTELYYDYLGLRSALKVHTTVNAFFTKVCATFLFHPTSFRGQKIKEAFLYFSTPCLQLLETKISQHIKLWSDSGSNILSSPPLQPPSSYLKILIARTWSHILFNFPRKFVISLAVNGVKVVGELMAGYRSPTPTLYPHKSLQTTVHRKIGVHQEPQCLRF